MSDMADESESMTAIVRRIVQAELVALEKRATERHFLSEEDADLLAKLALILQRVRRNDTTSGGEAGEVSSEALMRKASAA